MVDPCLRTVGGCTIYDMEAYRQAKACRDTLPESGVWENPYLIPQRESYGYLATVAIYVGGLALPWAGIIKLVTEIKDAVTV